MQLWSPALIRRYAPPTCTLEIRAQTSPLSQWTGQTVLKGVKFRLSFDDPRLADRPQVVITGEQAQLEALAKALQFYLSQQLAPGRAIPPLVLGERVMDYTHPQGETIAQALTWTTTMPAFKSLGLLRHELCLGSLAPSPNQPSVCLSVTQLFDLAEALENYATEFLTLPLLHRQEKGDRLAWGTVAAAFVVVVGVGYWVQDQQKKKVPVQETAFLSLPSPQGESLKVLTPDPRLADFPAQPQLKLPMSAVESHLQPSPRSAPKVVSPPPLSFEPKIPHHAALRQPSLLPLPKQPATGQVLSMLPPPGDDSVQGNAPLVAEAIPSVALRQIPVQVEELRTYLQGIWTMLNDRGHWTLEYQARLNSQGYLETITPLGEAARQQVGRLGLAWDRPVVSPWQGGAIDVRLVLSPDGHVQGFLLPQDGARRPE